MSFCCLLFFFFKLYGHHRDLHKEGHSFPTRRSSDLSDHVRRSLEVNHEGLGFLTREVAKLGLEQVPSCANFILIRVENGHEVFEQLLRQGVIVRPMGVYQLPQYVRVTVGTMEENRQFIEALRKIIKA